MTADTATIVSFITLLTLKLIAYVNPVHFVNLVLYIAFTKDCLSKGKNMTRHLWYLCCECLFFIFAF